MRKILSIFIWLGILAALTLITEGRQSATNQPLATATLIPQCTTPEFITPATANDQEDPDVDSRYIVWKEFTPGSEVIRYYDRGFDGIYNTADDGGLFTVNSPYSVNGPPKIDNGKIVWRAGNAYPYLNNILSCTPPNCATAPPAAVLIAPANHFFLDLAFSGNRIAYVQRSIYATSTEIHLRDLTTNADTIIFQGGASLGLALEGDLLVWQHIPYSGYQADIYAYDISNNIPMAITASPNESDLFPRLSKFPLAPIYMLAFDKTAINPYTFNPVYTLISNGAFLPFANLPTNTGSAYVGAIEVTALAQIKAVMVEHPSFFPDRLVWRTASPPTYNWTGESLALPNNPPWAPSWWPWSAWWGAYGADAALYDQTLVINQFVIAGNTMLSVTHCL